MYENIAQNLLGNENYMPLQLLFRGVEPSLLFPSLRTSGTGKRDKTTARIEHRMFAIPLMILPVLLLNAGLEFALTHSDNDNSLCCISDQRPPSLSLSVGVLVTSSLSSYPCSGRVE